jgi:hypothetical protein
MADECEPGWTTFGRHRPVMLSQNATDDILINTCSERQIDLFSDLWTSPTRIPLFHLDNGPNQILRRSFRAGFRFGLG